MRKKVVKTEMMKNAPAMKVFYEDGTVGILGLPSDGSQPPGTQTIAMAKPEPPNGFTVEDLISNPDQAIEVKKAAGSQVTAPEAEALRKYMEQNVQVKDKPMEEILQDAKDDAVYQLMDQPDLTPEQMRELMRYQMSK